MEKITAKMVKIKIVLDKGESLYWHDLPKSKQAWIKKNDPKVYGRVKKLIRQGVVELKEQAQKQKRSIVSGPMDNIKEDQNEDGIQDQSIRTEQLPAQREGEVSPGGCEDGGPGQH